jgi:hypothetical protein
MQTHLRMQRYRQNKQQASAGQIVQTPFDELTNIFKLSGNIDFLIHISTHQRGTC